MQGVPEPCFHTFPYHAILCHESCVVLRLLDHGRPWVAAQPGPHTWRRRTKQGQVWRSRRAAVMLRRKMPEPFVRSISRKRLTQRRLLTVCMTYAMEVMNLSPRVRQHSFRNPAAFKTVPRTNSLRSDAKTCKGAFVFLLLNFCNLNSAPLPFDEFP